MTRAACADAGLKPEAWFGHPDSPDGREAIAICLTCPVRLDCLTDAVRAREEWGIWGGIPTEERLRWWPSTAHRTAGE
jgi:WhiB family transcriptional regulator, redox-sensing transcriptional regulator